MTDLQLSDFNESAVESTKAHYFKIHESIRIRILDSLKQIEQVNLEISLADAADLCFQQSHTVEDRKPVEEVQPVRKSRDKRVRELWHRICRLCHPDKCKKHDPELIRFMNAAQESYNDNNLEELEAIYDQVMMYAENPKRFIECRDIVITRTMIENDPWYAVHHHHITGDLRGAFLESFRLLTEILSSNVAQYNHLRSVLDGILSARSS